MTNPIREGAKQPDLVRLWQDSMIYVSFEEAPDFPAAVDDVPGEDWLAAGILDGSAGVDEDVESETGDHYGWGGILTRRTFSKAKLTQKFTALEDNEVTHRLRWAGAEPGDDLPTPRPVAVWYILELYDEGLDYTHRYLAKRKVEIQRDGTGNYGEENPTSYAFEVTVFPDGEGYVFSQQFTGQDNDPGDEGGTSG